MHDTTIVKDPPQAGGVIVAPRVDNVDRVIPSIVARKASNKTSVGRSRLILADTDLIMHAMRDDQEMIQSL